MDDQDWLAQRFEANRSHLRGVADRMLGFLTEAVDAVQDAWIRMSRTDMRVVADRSIGGSSPPTSHAASVERRLRGSLRCDGRSG
jgi:DNA-directed RNA polymerase specialized sigma24 family protein